MGRWRVMAWVTQYSAPNVVGARKLKALIFYTINQLLYEKPVTLRFEPHFGGGSLEATDAVHLRLIGELVVDFLLVIIELFFARCLRFVTIHAFDRRTDGRTDRCS